MKTLQKTDYRRYRLDSVHFEIGRLEANVAMELGYQIPNCIWNQVVLEVNTLIIDRTQRQIQMACGGRMF